MHNNKTKRKETQKIFLGETIKEKTQNFLRDRMSTNGSSKTQRKKRWSPQLFSLSLSLSLTWESLSSLTHVPQWVSVCMINKEAHSLFIFFRSLNFHFNMLASLNNYLVELTSLGVSNGPSAPQLVENLPPSTNKGVILNTTVGTISLTHNNSPKVDFSRIV